jgi:putative transposase
MTYDPLNHNRRSIRLKGFDYSQNGEYFITICTYDREPLFGDVVDGEMILNEYGKMAEMFWKEIPLHFPDVELDEFVIMPNHVHGIVVINRASGFVGVPNIGVSLGVQNFEPLQEIPQQNLFQKTIPRSIGSIIRGYKTGVTKWFRNNTEIYSVWQRNYYERIIRTDAELNNIREYIINNPSNWGNDEKFPEK